MAPSAAFAQQPLQATIGPAGILGSLPERSGMPMLVSIPSGEVTGASTGVGLSGTSDGCRSPPAWETARPARVRSGSVPACSSSVFPDILVVSTCDEQPWHPRWIPTGDKRVKIFSLVLPAHAPRCPVPTGDLPRCELLGR